MARMRPEPDLDRELDALPQDPRWREWMDAAALGRTVCLSPLVLREDLAV